MTLREWKDRRWAQAREKRASRAARVFARIIVRAMPPERESFSAGFGPVSIVQRAPGLVYIGKLQ